MKKGAVLFILLILFSISLYSIKLNAQITEVSSSDSSSDSSSGYTNTISTTSFDNTCEGLKKLCNDPYCLSYCLKKNDLLLSLIKLFYKDPCDSCCDVISSESTITIDTTAAPTGTSVNTMSPTSSDNPDSSTSSSTDKTCKTYNDCDATKPVCNKVTGKCINCREAVFYSPSRDLDYGPEPKNKEDSPNNFCERFPNTPKCVMYSKHPKVGQCVECDDSISDPYACFLKNQNTPICKDNKCSKCQQNSDCGSINKRFCNTDGLCTDCRKDSDCFSLKPYCNTIVGECQKNKFDITSYKECKTDNDCDIINPFCFSGKCIPCDYITEDPSHCSRFKDKRICNPKFDEKKGQCVECYENTHCSTGICKDHVCQQCVKDSDCRLSQYGLKYCINGQCEQCLTNKDCPSISPYCKNNKCEEYCSSNNDCPSDKNVCTTNGKCVDCVANSDCSKDKPVCETSINKCVNCIFNSDCKDNKNKFCIKNTQFPEGKCSECLTNAYCTAKYGNDPSRNICSSNGICTRCGIDSDCKDPWPPFCNDGVCTNNCREDKDCIKIFPKTVVDAEYVKCKSLIISGIFGTKDLGKFCIPQIKLPF